MVLHGPSVPPTRVAQACIPCHRTKTRCDGRQPVCSTCGGKSKSCEWPQPRGKSSSRSPSGSSTTLETTPNLVTLPGTLTETMSLADLPMQTILPSTMSTIDFSIPKSQQLLTESMILQSQRIYFEHFHPQWPLLHRGLYETTAQPGLLVRAVVTTGLWFDGLSQSKDLSARLHDQLLIETGNELLDLLEQSKQGLLSPSTGLLPVFQATLIAMILVPYRADKSMENIMITHAMLLEIFEGTGVYDQSEINAGSRLCGHSSYVWVFRELYQRLAVFQYKLHLILQTLFMTTHPMLRLSRTAEPALLRVKLPLPLMVWDGPIAQWCGGLVPADPALLEMSNGNGLLVSQMCEEAMLTMDNRPLVPLLSWDRCLGMAIWCWCLRGNESDEEFIENIKPFVLDPLKGHGPGTAFLPGSS
ncbi:early growth response protein 1 is a zinc-finger protein [Colletotrichum zoysiae]|uniref:Early growth response protein 1 is a zinc-finger protein n=1 Tax=Colletotrichum zoysiae TaxID=1216348 RepID=A0AAD9HEI4_9PEZI|nr:early growth response protein 1 is a zinc-finger protein [Colletotrichum zoysiae]